MVEASKLCMLGPQDSIFQHPLEPEAGPEGGIRNTMLKALQRWMPQEPIFLHLLEPETGLGVASKNTNNVFFKRPVC